MSEDEMYEVHRSEELGRFLVAVREIEPREIIIREEPLMSGPADRGPKDIPVCLGCCSVMHIEPMNRCSNCGWPVCDENCEKLPSHALNECQLFHKNRGTYPPPYGWPTINKCIFILRCLLLKSQNPSSWEKLMLMSDNKEIRSNKPNCINSDRKILVNFQKFFPAEADLSEEEVVRISGIIDVNAHAFPLRIKGQTASVCNLYSKTSLISHSCTPNASWCPDKSFSSLTLTIRANVPISKGEMISVAYDEGQILVCTLMRLIPNEINGMFICRCKRCLDPTELGTYIGALKCSSCQQGYLLPIDPVDSFSSWKCDDATRSTDAAWSGCDVELDDESIMEIIEEAESMCGYTKLDFASDPQDEESLDLLKEFVMEYSGNILHPNHYILQEVNVRILKGEYAKGLSSLSEVDLIQYLERCEKLLSLSNILTPGYCEYRAFLQFHFSQGLLSLERRKETEKQNSALGYPASINQNPAEADSSQIEPEQVKLHSDDDAISSHREDSLKEYYGNTSENLKNLMGMLTFLLTYFKEISSSHKLLEPISDSVIETQSKLRDFENMSISE